MKHHERIPDSFHIDTDAFYNAIVKSTEDYIYIVDMSTDTALVPLRYNNDKQKKPLFSRGLSVCRLLFNSFSKLKIDENYKEKRRLFY